ncbi:unnamed protein product [Cyclocybe aegerita]|uniref:Uncharacterized protein n=1 Tax=Cyclocybe aegerita TaxID=1973307 RepID=A0A8S0XR11_CYCAE|nr:unnamed protein product [Cyclocybe aegerita]
MEEACARAIVPHFTYDFADALKRSACACRAQEYAGRLPLTGAAPKNFGVLFSDSPLTSPETSCGGSHSTTLTPTSTYNALPASAAHPTAAEAAPATLTGKKARKKRQGHSLRNKQRKIEREEAQKVLTKAEPRQSVLVKPAIPTQTTYNISSIPSASTGFICLPDVGECHPVMRLKELVDKELLILHCWDGRSVSPIVSCNNQVIGLIAGCPAVPDWDDVCREAYEALCQVREACDFMLSAADHRRGNFLVKNVGVGAGFGHKKPANVAHTEHNTRQLDTLLQNPAIQRISCFADNIFATWFPKVYKHYGANFDALLKGDSSLCHNFANSVDFTNLPFGLCSVTALGDFNPAASACFVFYDLGIIVQFPPGSTLILTSAAIVHANSSMGPGETRCSITQYTPGGLFRWVEHGFQLDRKFYSNMMPQAWEKELEAMEERCKMGLSLFSTLDELKAAAAAAAEIPHCML